MSNKQVLFIFIFILSFYPKDLYSQRIFFQNRDGDPDPVGRLVTEAGGNVIFNINSLKRYNEGMVLTDWTRIAISVTNLEPTVSWRLELRTSHGEFYGDVYGRELDLDYVTILVREMNPDPDPANQLTTFDVDPLTTGPQTIVSYQGSGFFQILLSYSIGEDPANPLLGEHPDYFLLDLIIDLVED